MIKSHDRKGWFGASDTSYIMGNWETATFARWWLEKMGVPKPDYKTPAMQTGTHYEHRILDYLGVKKRDRQIRYRPYRLRVNLDGEDLAVIEVKTSLKAYDGPTPAHWRQVQVQMAITGKSGVLAAYRVTEDEYDNYFLPIDATRLSMHDVEYDRDWITRDYLPRLKYLATCLKRKSTPKESEFNAWQGNHRCAIPLSWRIRRAFYRLSSIGL